MSVHPSVRVCPIVKRLCSGNKPCRAGTCSKVPREAQLLSWPRPLVLWLWHFICNIGPHPMFSLHIYVLAVSLIFIADVASQAGDADSSLAPGLTSCFQRSIYIGHSITSFLPQWQCIRVFFFVFYNYYLMGYFFSIYIGHSITSFLPQWQCIRVFFFRILQLLSNWLFFLTTNTILKVLVFTLINCRNTYRNLICTLNH